MIKFNCFIFLVLSVAVLFVQTHAFPYQELAPRAGHVPVYIREGNTPLSEIHPKLAEAFHENEDSNNAAEIDTASTNDAPETDSAAEPVTTEDKSEITTINPVEVTESDIASFDNIKV